MAISAATLLAAVGISVQQYLSIRSSETLGIATNAADAAVAALGNDGGDVVRSAILALGSLAVADTVEGRSALRSSLDLLPERPVVITQVGEPVLSLGFGPDAGHLLVGTATSGARLCDIEGGDCGLTLDIDGYVRAVAFSPDGRYILAAGAKTKVWDTRSPGAPLFETSEGQRTAWSADFKHIAVGDAYGYFEIWRVDDAERTATVALDGGVFALAFSHDGRLIASGDSRGSVRVWRVPDGDAVICANGDPVHWQQTNRINSVAFLPGVSNDLTLAYGSGENSHKPPDYWAIIQANCEGKPPKSIKHGSIVREVAFSDNGRILLTANENEVIAAPYESNLTGPRMADVYPTKRYEGKIFQAFFLPGEQQIVVARADSRRDQPTGTIHFATLDGPDFLRIGLRSFPTASAVSGNGKLLATGESDGTVKLWRLAPPDRRGELNKDSTSALVGEACRKISDLNRRVERVLSTRRDVFHGRTLSNTCP